MEHRWHARKTSQLDVVVHTVNMGYIRGQITNLSNGGAYVETAPGIGLSRNTLVKIAAPTAQDGRAVAAIVVRRESGAFAAMFLDPVPWSDQAPSSTDTLEESKTSESPRSRTGFDRSA
jgi:hypothetical protein